MSRTIKPIRKGEPITADFLEALRREVVKTIRVAAPLQMSETAAGTFISFAGSFTQREKLVAKTGGDGIPARSGNAPGRAEVTLYEIADPEAAAPVLVVAEDDEGQPRTIDAFNLSSTEVAGDVYVMLAYGSGVWWVDYEDCPEEE